MIEMNNIPKLIEFTVEELQEQLKDKKIDKEFLIEYIVKRNRVYNQLIDKIDSMTESYETDAEAKFYEYVDKHESKLQQRIDKIFSRITLYKMEDITMETARVLDDLLEVVKGDSNE